MSKSDDLKKRTGLEMRAQLAARSKPPVVAVKVKTRREQLDEYREVVVTGQRNFVTVGTALGLIAKEQLFKEAGHASFEAMVQDEFDMSTSTAYRLVDAARVVTILSQVGTVETKIKNQTQALSLAPLGKDREAMVRVIAAAEARGRVTAELLADVRIELYPHTKVIDGEVVGDQRAIEAPADEPAKNAAADQPAARDAEPPTTSVTASQPDPAGVAGPDTGDGDVSVPVAVPTQSSPASGPAGEGVPAGLVPSSRTVPPQIDQPGPQTPASPSTVAGEPVPDADREPLGGDEDSAEGTGEDPFTEWGWDLIDVIGRRPEADDGADCSTDLFDALVNAAADLEDYLAAVRKSRGLPWGA